MTRSLNQKGRWGANRLTLILALTAGMLACDTEAMLEVDEPSFATPGTLNNLAGLPTLYAGALGDFQVAMSGAGLNDAYLSNTALFSDELRSSDTFTTRNATDYRESFPVEQGNTSDLAYNLLQYGRRSTSEVADVVAELIGKTDPRYATLKALEGMTIVGLGEAFCGAVPLGTAKQGAPGDLGTPLTTQQLFEEAVKRFDEALAANPNLNLAKVGKARALLNNAQYAAAATAVSGVPTSFIHFLEHSSNAGRQYNPIFSLQDNRRYTMSDVEGINGLNYVTANDPRTPWYMHTQIGFDNTTPVVRSARYRDYGGDVPVADGIQARLIEAEAALKAGSATWLTILNDLRAQVGPLMTARYGNLSAYPQSANALAPLTDPGTETARVNLLFRERAFWLYLTGTRLGDMRRLIRQYGRSAESVFPTGAWHKGGVYGTDVNLPIPFNEQQNPNYDKTLCNTKQP